MLCPDVGFLPVFSDQQALCLIDEILEQCIMECASVLCPDVGFPLVFSDQQALCWMVRFLYSV